MTPGQIDQITLEAQKEAAKCAIEYLTEINKTDIKQMSSHEWFTLIDVITKNYHNKCLYYK